MLPELVSWLILVGSRLRGLEWRTLLGDELSLILLTWRGALISWRLSLRKRLLELCISNLIPCVKLPAWRTGWLDFRDNPSNCGFQVGGEGGCKSGWDGGDGEGLVHFGGQGGVGLVLRFAGAVPLNFVAVLVPRFSGAEEEWIGLAVGQCWARGGELGDITVDEFHFESPEVVRVGHLV